MHGRLDSREISDIGDTALSFSEVKALATGNPLLMDKAEADATLARLQRAERAHHRNQAALEHAIEHNEAEIRSLTWQAANIDTAISRRHHTRGDAFTMTVADREHHKRAEAGQHLKDLVEREFAALDRARSRNIHPGSLAGFPLVAAIERSLGKTTITLILDGAPVGTLQLSASDLRAADPAGLITRLEHRLHRLETRKQETLAHIERARREIFHARENVGQPFPLAAQLAEARERVRQIDEQLDRMATEHHDGDADAKHEPDQGCAAGHEGPGAPPRPAPKEVGASHERSSDPAVTRPETRDGTLSPTRQPEADSPPSSPETDGRSELREGKVRSRPWQDPHMPSTPATPATPGGREEQHQSEQDHCPSSYGSTDWQHLRDVGGHQTRSSDWRDAVMRSVRETWARGPVQPLGTTKFRYPEPGGPEIGA